MLAEAREIEQKKLAKLIKDKSAHDLFPFGLLVLCRSLSLWRLWGLFFSCSAML